MNHVDSTPILNRLPREVVKSLPVDVFKRHGEVVPGTSFSDEHSGPSLHRELDDPRGFFPKFSSSMTP